MKRKQWERVKANFNFLNETFKRPNVRRVIVAYGVDIATEVGYVYEKGNVDVNICDIDDRPTIKTTVWEHPSGQLFTEDNSSPIVTSESSSFSLLKRTRSIVNSARNIGEFAWINEERELQQNKLRSKRKEVSETSERASDERASLAQLKTLSLSLSSDCHE